MSLLCILYEEVEATKKNKIKVSRRIRVNKTKKNDHVPQGYVACPDFAGQNKISFIKLLSQVYNDVCKLSVPIFYFILKLKLKLLEFGEKSCFF